MSLLGFARREEVDRLRQQVQDLEEQATHFAAIGEFARLLLSASDDAETILWDIAQGVVSKLRLDGCVFYLCDESGRKLVQKAAHGPKGTFERRVNSPLVLRFGEGVVGAAAESRRTVYVPDTRLDPRYIPDDMTRLSELAIPLQHEDRVIGVMDMQRQQPQGFPQPTAQMLETIASLTAERLGRALLSRRARSQEDLLRLIAENISDLFVIVDERGRRIFASRSYEKLFASARDGDQDWASSTIHPEDRKRVEWLFLNRTLDQAGQRAEFRYLLPDGRICTIEANGTPVVDADGTTWRNLVVGRDITARKEAEVALQRLNQELESRIEERTHELAAANTELRAEVGRRQETEAALVESLQRTANIVEGATDAIVTIDVQGNIVDWNSKATAIFGFEKENVIGRNLAALIIPERYRKQHLIGMQRFRDTGEGKNFGRIIELSALHRDGHEFPIELSLATLKVANQTLFSGFIRDISERKRLEAELKHSLAERETILENSIVGIAFLNAHGQIQWVNSALEQMFGGTRDRFLGGRVAQFYLSPEAYADVAGQVAEALRDGRTFETELQMLRTDGTPFWVYLSGKSVDRRNLRQGTVWVLMDITRRKELEAALQRTTALQEAILQSSLVGITYLVDGRHQWANKRFCDLLGYSAEEIVGHTGERFYRSKEVFEWVRQRTLERFAAGLMFETEIRLRRRDGSAVWTYISGTPLDFRDLSQGTVWVVVDIDARKRLERVLERTTAEQEAILQNTLVGISLSVDRVHQWVNQRFAEMFGYAPEEMIGRSSLVHFSSETAWRELGELAYPVIITGKPWSGQVQMKRKDGRQIWVQLYGKVIDVHDPSKGSIWTYLDVTDRHQAEEEIRHALAKQRELNELKSRFVSMTSHEFRTPLATILSSAELLGHYGEQLDADTRQEMIGQIEHAVTRMTEMLDKVLLIGRGDAGSIAFIPQPLPLWQFCNQLADEVISAFSKPVARHKIELAREGDVESAIVDEKLLRNIFGNLLSNAIKYSPSGGTVRFSVARRNSHLEFAVADEGIGIPPDDLERLFETFHRAQNVGAIAGTGLGLAIVKKAVDLHGGTISVRSEVNKGTEFVVTIPGTLSADGVVTG